MIKVSTIANTIHHDYRCLRDLETICKAQAISKYQRNKYDIEYTFRDNSKMRVYSNPCPIFATTII